MGNFQPLEVVDRGSETQPQVVENLNQSTPPDKGIIMSDLPYVADPRICQKM